jgi:hypothetical protein
VTGKTTSGPGYAPSPVVHSETVLRRFYELTVRNTTIDVGMPEVRRSAGRSSRQ